MKDFKSIKKFVVNWKLSFIMLIIIIFSFSVYYACYTDSQTISVETAQISETEGSEYYRKQMAKKIKLDTACNILITIITISASTFLTSIFIERRDKNNIIEDVIVNDLFTSESFINKLDEEKFNNLLSSLESKKHFSNNKIKAEMYAAIREKLNNAPLDGKPLYYEKCSYDINCKEYATHIEKEFIKTIKVKSLNGKFREKKFILLSIASCPIDGVETSEIKSFKIDGKNIDLKYIQKQSYKVDAMNVKQGYDEGTKYIYDKPIDFSVHNIKTIEIEYITRTPIDDGSYSCRLPYPCKSFNFKFSLDSKNYKINPIAFGFIDDAKDSPNRPRDRKNVTINFEDWIFPLDGVCVFLEKNTCKQ